MHLCGAVVLVALALGVGEFVPSTAAAHRADALPAVEQLLQQGLQGGSGGVYGYYLKQVRGPVLAAENDGLVYDPASALKTLLLAYAFKQVAAGQDALTDSVTVYQYPSSRNANGDPQSPNLCPDPADEVPANVVSPAPSLSDVLSGMMQISNNRYTRAIELRYGRDNLQAFASSLGLTNTNLPQIFGCGDDGGVQNSWTLDDAGKLYEALAANNVVPAQDTTMLFNTMLRWDGSTFNSIVAPEAKELGIPSAATSFLGGVTAFHKGGSYDLCHGSCVADDEVIRDEAGTLSVPVQTSHGVAPAVYVWGVFIANLQASCPSFPCATADGAQAAVQSAAIELQQPALVSALQTWAGLTTLTAAPSVYRAGELRLRARLAYQGRDDPIAGQSIQFAASGLRLCTSQTGPDGTATCETPLPKKAIRSYAAMFAGSTTLRAATATGQIASPILAVTLRLRVQGQGAVRSLPTGINCQASCAHTFHISAWIRGINLVARPRAKGRVSWSGACRPSGLSCLAPLGKRVVVVEAVFRS